MECKGPALRLGIMTLIPWSRFRWVFRQLDMLRRSFPGSIRRALNELPRTLDETYERILLGIDEEKWEYALRLLQCLAVARRPLTARELAEVLAVEFNTGDIPKLNVDLHPRDADKAIFHFDRNHQPKPPGSRPVRLLGPGRTIFSLLRQGVLDF